MATSLTQAQLRDDIRRKIQVVPLFDITGVSGDIGQPNSGQPDPNNITVNNAINEAIQAVNRVVRVGPLTYETIAVTAPASTFRGPFYVDISSVIPNPLVVTEIFDVTFTSPTTTIRLQPYNYYAAKKPGQQFIQQTPGRVVEFILTGNQIGLLTPPIDNGNLSFSVAAGIPPLTVDASTIQYLPVDFQSVVQYGAVTLLMYRRATDIESQTRAQSFGQMFMQGISTIYQWKNGFDDSGLESVKDTLRMMPWDEMQRRAGIAPGGSPQQGQQQGGSQ